MSVGLCGKLIFPWMCYWSLSDTQSCAFIAVLRVVPPFSFHCFYVKSDGLVLSVPPDMPFPPSTARGWNAWPKVSWDWDWDWAGTEPELGLMLCWPETDAGLCLVVFLLFYPHPPLFSSAIKLILKKTKPPKTQTRVREGKRKGEGRWGKAELLGAVTNSPFSSSREDVWLQKWGSFNLLVLFLFLFICICSRSCPAKKSCCPRIINSKSPWLISREATGVV